VGGRHSARHLFRTRSIGLAWTEREGINSDRLASVLDRDRSYLINEAVEAFLAVHAWQIDHIGDGLRQAEAGDFADEQEVAAFWERF
jgi:predicted transcriptional regulator